MAILGPVTRDKRWTWLGLGYGCILWVFAFGSAGMGHGTYLPFGIYGAPLSVVPFVGLFIAPVWWGTLGSMFTRRRRGAAAVMMTLHTIAVGMVLWFGTPMEHGEDRWEYFLKTERFMPMWLWSGIAVYVAGMLVAWVATLTLGRSEHE